MMNKKDMKSNSQSTKTHLDGVRKSEGDDITGPDTGGEKRRGGLINKLIQPSVGEIQLSRNGKRAVGGALCGLLLQQTS